jgi:hypothetical protein
MKNNAYKKLYYWHGNNFGDELNRILFNKIFNMKFEFVLNPFEAEYIAIGSLLECYIYAKGVNRIKQIINSFGIKKSKETIVFGSGFHFEPENLKFLQKMDFQMVRGKLTEMVLRKNKYITRKIVLGDLGMLSSYLYNGKKEKKYQLGIIPHLNDLDSPIFYDIYKKYKPQSILINVKDTPEKVIQDITSCRNIVSSSLHGLIVADSFNIPNLWLENKYKLPNEEHRFKYLDYYSIFDVNNMSPLRAIDFLNCDITCIKELYKIDFNEVEKKQNELYDFCKKYF